VDLIPVELRVYELWVLIDLVELKILQLMVSMPLSGVEVDTLDVKRVASVPVVSGVVVGRYVGVGGK